MTPAADSAQSLVHRLSRALTVAVLVAWLVSTAMVAWYVNQQIQENFDVELVESAYRQLYPALLEAQLMQSPQRAQDEVAGPDILPMVMGELPGSEHPEPLLMQLRNGMGQVLLRTKTAPASPFAVPLQQGFYDTGDYRVFSLYDPQYQVWLQLADPLEERRATSQHTIMGLSIVLLVLLPLVVWLVTTVARRELRVVGQLQRQLTERSSSNLNPIPLHGMPVELRVVAEGVNQLLERLGEALNVERSLAANAAHELRTPLAEVRLRLHTAMEKALQHAERPHPTETACVPLEEVQTALQSLGALSHRTERLLQLSRAEGGDRAHFSQVDLVLLAEQVAQEFWQQSHAQKRLDFLAPNAQDAVWVWGDIDSLAVVLRNLIDNALKHSEGMVLLEVRSQPQPTLMVRDHGAGLTPAQIQRIQERHARLDRQHIGYGLGMSIVKTIVQKHDARLILTSPPEGMEQGLEARVQFPKQEQPS